MSGRSMHIMLIIVFCIVASMFLTVSRIQIWIVNLYQLHEVTHICKSVPKRLLTLAYFAECCVTCTMTYPFHFTGYMYFLSTFGPFLNSCKKSFLFNNRAVTAGQYLTISNGAVCFIVMLASCHYITIMSLSIQGKWKIKKGKKKKCRSVVMCSGQLVFALPGWVYGTVSTSPQHTHTVGNFICYAICG